MTSVAVRLFRPQDVPIQAAGRSPLIALRSRRRKPARPAARSAIMTDLNIRFHRLVAHRIQRALDDCDSVEHAGDAASKSRREHLKWLVTRARARVAEAEGRRRYPQPNRVS